MKKRAIVTESPRPAHYGRAPSEKPPAGPLVGARFEGAAAHPAQLPAVGPAEIAFAGRSNSGKSSAINALARQKQLAYASRTPGRTRQINFFTLRSGARVADLPGYGYAAVPKAMKLEWQDLLWDYLTLRTTLVGLVIVIDARHGMKGLDEDLLGGYLPSGRPALILATKSDKLGLADRRTAVATLRRRLDERFDPYRATVIVQTFSAVSRAGVEAADMTLAQWLPGAPP